MHKKTGAKMGENAKNDLPEQKKKPQWKYGYESSISAHLPKYKVEQAVIPTRFEAQIKAK